MKPFLVFCAFVFFSSLTTPGNTLAEMIDAPHNGTKQIACGDCHAYSLWWQFSPSLQSSAPDHGQISDILCLTCHGPGGSNIQVATHSSDIMGTTTQEWQWQRNCIDCHDPHFQKQLNWLDNDPLLADQFFLITATIESGTVIPDAETMQTSFSYQSADGIDSEWLDPQNWGAKNQAGNGLVLAVGKDDRDSTYIIDSALGNVITPGAADGSGSMTVAGLMNPAGLDGVEIGLFYGQLIRMQVNGRAVKFFSPADPSYAFIDKTSSSPPQGLCQVCHTHTMYYLENGGGTAHYNTSCTNCHIHSDGFAHGTAGSIDQSCGTTGCHDSNKHQNHFSQFIGCEACHDVVNGPRDQNNNILFSDGETLTQTVACSACHWNGVTPPVDPTLPQLKTGWIEPSFDLACNGCHGTSTPSGRPDYPSGSPKGNSHEVHVVDRAIACGTCHAGTTTDGVSIASQTLHLNNIYDLQAGNGEHFDYTFAAAGGNCADISCHANTSATWGEPDSVSCSFCHIINQGSRRAAVSEFPASGGSHGHFGSQLDNNSCRVCHDQVTHKDGYVDLLDPDGGPNYRFITPDALNADPDLSNFCANCHDNDGASRLAAPFDPFGNGNIPPDVASRFLGTVQWEEDYQFGGTLRRVNSHHDISDADQSWSGAKLECLNCHGSHISADTQPLADPFSTNTPWTASTNAFCLACHNGGLGPFPPTPTNPYPRDPIEPQFPVGVNGPSVELRGLGDCDYPGPQNQACDEDCDYFDPDYNMWNVEYPWSIHSHGKGSKRSWPGYYPDGSTPLPAVELNCLDCHDAHGSYSPENPGGNPYMIRDFVDGSGYTDDGHPGNFTSIPGGSNPVVMPIISIDLLGYCSSFPSYCGTRPQFENLCVTCHASYQTAAPHYHLPAAQVQCQQCHGHGPAFSIGQEDNVLPLGVDSQYNKCK